MFNAISWQGYWTFLALLSTTYYCLIGLVYYRKEIISRLSPKRFSSTRVATQSLFKEGDIAPAPLPIAGFQSEKDFQAPPLNTEEHIVYACMDELTAFFEGARSRKWNRMELLQSIKNVLCKYPSLKGSEYKDTIVQVISTHSEQYCSIHLKEEDRIGLW